MTSNPDHFNLDIRIRERMLKKHVITAASVEAHISSLKDSVGKAPTYSLQDVLLSGLAIFSQKCPSLLAFENDLAASNAKTHNLKQLLGIKNIPSDTQMRERIDRIDQNQLRSSFLDLHKHAKNNGVYDKFEYNGKFLLAVDGTGFYSSNSISCAHCMTKKRTSGESFSMMAAFPVKMESSAIKSGIKSSNFEI